MSERVPGSSFPTPPTLDHGGNMPCSEEDNAESLMEVSSKSRSA